MSILSAIVLLGILIFVHELGHFLIAKLMGVKVLKFSLGFGPKIIGKTYGDTEYLLSAVPLGGYVKMLGQSDTPTEEEEIPEAEKHRAYNFQPVWKRFAIVVTGPLFNMLLTYLIYVVVLSANFPIHVPNIKAILPVIEKVTEDSPAYKAGLRDGDRVLKIDTTDIDTWFGMVEIIRKNPGKQLEFVVKREKEKLAFKIVPNSVEVKEENKKITIGQIGIMKNNLFSAETIKSSSFPEALYKSAIATYKMGFFIFDSISVLIKGEISSKNIGGPITILKESGKAASAGFMVYIMFMALFSVNLGVLNLLPIPVLDGGHLMFLVIEAIRRKPLSEKFLVNAHKVGFVLLMALMVFALYNDIVRWITGRMLQ
jgi:regulator of sigma E protease